MYMYVNRRVEFAQLGIALQKITVLLLLFILVSVPPRVTAVTGKRLTGKGSRV